MRLHQHVIASAAVSAGIYGISRSPVLAVTSFFAGFLVDLDHVVDYWREHPGRLDRVHFFRTCEEFRLKKVYLFLHSVELMVLLGFLACVLRCPWLLGTLLGLVQHLLLDTLVNSIYPAAYFFSYRLRQGFVNEKVFIIPGQYRGAKR